MARWAASFSAREASLTARICTARKAAFFAPSTATVATGMPEGICTVLSRASSPLMAEAMGKPLVSVPSDGSEEGDMAAMREVLSGLDVDGIVVGALWSDYQWDRMNSICDDLGLVVLAPLWRKDQDLIYDEMVSAGIDAAIVGVFAEGLDAEWLGRRLDAETKQRLCRLRDRYGLSIMGEGGEYESMTLDSPMHSSRLEIRSSEKVMERDAGTLRVKDVVLVPK